MSLLKAEKACNPADFAFQKRQGHFLLLLFFSFRAVKYKKL